MRIEDFTKEFEKRVSARGLTLSALPIADALDLMMRFYREVPVTGIEPPPDDALKFSWGVRYRGAGDHFEINLARVVTTRRAPPPHLVRECELTYRFTPTTDLSGIPANEIWCYSRGELAIFAAQVRASEAYAVPPREQVLSISVLYSSGTS